MIDSKSKNQILSFLFAGLLLACSSNGVTTPPDADADTTPDPSTSVDCGSDADANGVGDLCQVLVPVDDCGEDLNGNDVGDDCEVTVEVPVDECGEDSDGNGIGDACEVEVTVEVPADCGDDANGNGIGDDCEVEVPADCGDDLNGNGVGDDCEVEVPASPQVTIDTFSITPSTQIFAGETLTLTYAVSESEEIYFNGDRISDASGTMTLTPTESENYLLWAGNDASAAERNLNVSVAGIEHLSGQGKTYLFIRTSPLDSDLVFAGRDDGLYKSTNGGASFAKVSAVDQPVVSLAFDPKDADKIVIGTDGSAGTDGYVMVSSDGGDHFETTLTVGESSNGPGVVFSSIAISPTNSDKIYATYEMGLAYSSNGGAGWARIDEFGGKQVNAVLYAEDGEAYFGAEDGLYELASSDFKRVSISGKAVTALAWDNGDAGADKLYIGTADGEVGIWQSDEYTKVLDGFDAVTGLAHVSTKDLLFVGAADGLSVSRAGGDAVKIQGNDELSSVTSFDFVANSSGKIALQKSYRILLTGESAGVSELSWSQSFLLLPIKPGVMIKDWSVLKNTYKK